MQEVCKAKGRGTLRKGEPVGHQRANGSLLEVLHPPDLGDGVKMRCACLLRDGKRHGLPHTPKGSVNRWPLPPGPRGALRRNPQKAAAPGESTEPQPDTAQNRSVTGRLRRRTRRHFLSAPTSDKRAHPKQKLGEGVGSAPCLRVDRRGGARQRVLSEIEGGQPSPRSTWKQPHPRRAPLCRATLASLSLRPAAKKHAQRGRRSPQRTYDRPKKRSVPAQRGALFSKRTPRRRGTRRSGGHASCAR